MWVFLLICVGLLAGGLYYRYHVSLTDERGATRLMQALEQHAQLGETKKFIRRSGDINERDKAGQTALFYAARHTENPEVIRQLLEAGADLHLADNNGQTALMVAAKENPTVAVLEEFTKNGAHVDAKNNAGETPLWLAARYNSPAVVKALFQARANPDELGPNGQTVAQALAENEKFSEQERTDYRQAMLVLSILRGGK